ncbi:unnamed protein product [Coffea canephora]|uniref:DH200=94 genomic scaffold, scaffold_5451 n=1 Tax=Coffea canephora TaxID=49390 RepID=A0A068VM10_COFCA|nr:unnamed protein product [Coffea canephora]CDP21652.1 unnamed protein product [Coffea canephora]
MEINVDNYLLHLVLYNICIVYCKQHVPCFFIFGESMLHNGNNNFLNTSFKAKYPPYGVDYPDGRVGRFSNAELVGLERGIPPFANTKRLSIMKGVNYYSSSGSGILDATGHELVRVLVIPSYLSSLFLFS